MSSSAFPIRPATRVDIPVLNDLVERSIRGLAGGYYDRRQIDSSLRYLYQFGHSL